MAEFFIDGYDKKQKPRYSHGVMEFTDSEIDQIVKLVLWRNTGPTKPYDARRLNRDVRQWALAVRLLKWERVNGRRRLVTLPGWEAKLNPELDLPPEALWRLTKPIIEESTGFAAAKSKKWASRLDIWWHNATGDEHQEQSYQEKLRVLLKLDQWSYINFQFAGDIWQIRVLGEESRTG